MLENNLGDGKRNFRRLIQSEESLPFTILDKKSDMLKGILGISFYALGGH